MAKITHNPYQRINGMWSREYRFFCHMRKRGIALVYLTQSVRGMFQLHRGRYTPDFYDEANNVYYEVVGTRQALNAGAHKYCECRIKYPQINIKVVRPDGTELSHGEGLTVAKALEIEKRYKVSLDVIYGTVSVRPDGTEIDLNGS